MFGFRNPDDMICYNFKDNSRLFTKVSWEQPKLGSKELGSQIDPKHGLQSVEYVVEDVWKTRSKDEVFFYVHRDGSETVAGGDWVGFAENDIIGVVSIDTSTLRCFERPMAMRMLPEPPIAPLKFSYDPLFHLVPRSIDIDGREPYYLNNVTSISDSGYSVEYTGGAIKDCIAYNNSTKIMEEPKVCLHTNGKSLCFTNYRCNDCGAVV